MHRMTSWQENCGEVAIGLGSRLPPKYSVLSKLDFASVHDFGGSRLIHASYSYSYNNIDQQTNSRNCQLKQLISLM